jgi:hypothetical protein
MDDIFSALPVLFDRHNDNEDVRRAVIFAVWRRIAGESLAGRAAPVGLNETRLTVAVADRNWQRNLEQLAKEMIFKMNYVFGTPEVKFIEFVIDADALRPSPPRTDRAEFESAALDQINDRLREAADGIQDDELRRRFLLAAGSCLARQERMAAK